LVQQRCEQDGIEVIRMSAEEQARFAKATEVVYDKYQDYFTSGLVDQIKKQ
jgi:TRAP-type C4-dicarboxylate transport system substrate-binding protein